MPKRARSPSKDRSAKIKKLKRQLSRMQAHLDRLVTSESSSDLSESSESDSYSGSPGEEREPQGASPLEPPDITPVSGASIANNQQVLSIFGENPNQPNKFDPNIHEELEARWTVYLREGLLAERRKDLLSKHLFPENCKALNPPKLNEEIRSLLPTYALKDDHFLSGLQEQLGAGMAILGSILSQKLGSPESELILADEAVEKLAEAGQLFANVHQAVSSKRKFEINPFLNTDCRSAAVKASVDDYLFGSDFLTKVKANREMKKAADEIKKSLWSSVFKLQAPISPVQDKRGSEGEEAEGAIHQTNPRRQAPVQEENNREEVSIEIIPQVEVYWHKIAGRLKLFAKHWREITDSSHILNWISGCNSWAKKDTERKLTFHRFPETNTRQVYIETEMGKHLMDQRKAWILKLKIGKQVSKSMKVCSLHFNKDDYFNKGNKVNHTERSNFKKTAVPSQKLPVSTVTSPKCAGTSSDRTDRYKRRESALCTSKNEDPQECDTETNVQAAENLVQLLKSTPDISEKDLDSAFVQNKKLRDAEVQVNIDRINTLSDLLKTNAALKSFTGINNFQILDCIVKMINEFCVTDVRSHRLNVRERVLLTMTKLKLDLSYVTLGALFSISGQLCKTYFFDFLTVLSQVLKVCIYFPSAEEVSKNLPKCFKNFKNCRAVLDCIEIFIQRPSCLCCRIKFYSQYKKSTTIKFMTGVSPGGIITFISKPYGGRASDKLIFEESDFIKNLSPNRDSIMVDKGFLIDDLCAMYKIRLIRPPFLKNKQQLTAQEATANKEIAAARVHIERSNQRLKIFKIISGRLQWSLSGLSYSSINCHRSAFSFVFNYTCEEQATLKRFFRELYNKRPAAPRYSATWDPYPVLNYLTTLFPVDTLTLKDLTLKLVTLLLLTSGHRVQTLPKISVESIIKGHDRIEIRIPDRIKTSGNRRKQPFLVFPYFRNQPQLCVASTIEYYLTKTRSYRSSTDRLLLTHQRPFHSITSQSISRWIKEILQRSGIDTTIFTSHSVRHAATSAAFR
nr:unnamed protein product [Callosobruchus analis]